VTLAHEMPQREITATDISPAALEVARHNAIRHGVERRVEFIEGDLAADLIGPFAAIVSNPPYVAEGDRKRLAPEVLREPAVALFAGADGLDVIRRIIAMAPRRLAPGGWLVFEIGQGQAPAVCALLRMDPQFEEISVLKDLAGIDRAIVARRR
jgi:release factor glutamine methyltransferase